jgi:hypothetical protein
VPNRLFSIQFNVKQCDVVTGRMLIPHAGSWNHDQQDANWSNCAATCHTGDRARHVFLFSAHNEVRTKLIQPTAATEAKYRTGTYGGPAIAIKRVKVFNCQGLSGEPSNRIRGSPAKAPTDTSRPEIPDGKEAAFDLPRGVHNMPAAASQSGHSANRSAGCRLGQ